MTDQIVLFDRVRIINPWASSDDYDEGDTGRVMKLTTIHALGEVVGVYVKWEAIRYPDDPYREANRQCYLNYNEFEVIRD